jgi:hypothetical protein
MKEVEGEGGNRVAYGMLCGKAATTRCRRRDIKEKRKIMRKGK